MEKVLYENLAEKLVEVVPEIRPQYESERQWWGEDMPGAHIIYGDVLDPYLISLLESCDQEDTLKRIFAFLEELANHEDAHVQEVVAVTVCEDLGANKKLLEKARKYMGDTTFRFSREVEASLG